MLGSALLGFALPACKGSESACSAPLSVLVRDDGATCIDGDVWVTVVSSEKDFVLSRKQSGCGGAPFLVEGRGRYYVTAFGPDREPGNGSVSIECSAATLDVPLGGAAGGGSGGAGGQ